MIRVVKYFVFVATILLAILPVDGAKALQKKTPASRDEVVLSFAPLVKQASPAVVNIYTKKKVTVRRSVSPFFSDPIFQHFFGGRFSNKGVTERIESSLGSGVIVKDDGYIITNHHVIANSTDIRVVLSDRREFEAKILIKDERTDLALLKIDTKGEKLDYLELMDSDDLEVGDIVMAIGNPFGVGQTVTNGIVSAVARTTVGASDYQFFIQTDAAINPGNSGGALINMQGKLAGINSAIFSRSGGSHGIGFAIPANMVATVVRSETSDIVRPWLGIAVQEVTYDIADSINLEKPLGAIVTEVVPRSPVDRAGIKVGDVIVKLDEHKILDEHELHYRIATYELGSKAVFRVIRGGKHKKITVKMQAPPENPKRDLRVISGKNPLSGTTIGNLSPALADEMGLNSMLNGPIIVSLDSGIASRLGLHKNDIIRKINGKDVSTSEEVEEEVGEESTKWKITVQRGNKLLNVIWNIR